MPRHSPQSMEQSNPALRQEQRRVSHPILQLHRTTFSNAFGTTSMLYCTGSSCGPSLDSPSILAPEGKHGGYGTWQLMMSEDGFQAGYLLMKAMQPQFTMRLVWLMSHPVCAEEYNAMQQLTGVQYNTSGQHKDLTTARQGKDMADSCELLKFLEFRNPFSDNCRLWSIVTGINATSVNVDTAK